MRSHRVASIVIIILMLFGGLVAWRAWQEAATEAGESDKGPSAMPVAVELADIESGLMRDVRMLSGTLEAATRFDVATKVGGLIEQLGVDLGDTVERGQVVARLDDEEFVQAVAQSEAELAVRQAERSQAEAELDRVAFDRQRLGELYERGVAADVEFSEVKTELASARAAVTLAEARVRQAGASLELAKIRLGYTTVRASWQGGPDRGTVGMRYEDAGDTVQAGDPLLAIVGLHPLKAVVTVTEVDYARLRVDQAATLTTDALVGETFEARISRIAPVFQESSRQARVELRVENPDRKLRPGMFVRVRIVLREEFAEMIVPAAAIVQRAGRDVVFTTNSSRDRVMEHVVETGIERGSRVQIISPALEGQIVVLGQHLLEDGAAITMAGADSRGDG